MAFSKIAIMGAIAAALIGAAPASAAVRTITGVTTFNLASLYEGGYADEYAAIFNVGRLNIAEFSFTFDAATRVDNGPSSTYAVSNASLKINGAPQFAGVPSTFGDVTVRTFDTVDLYSFGFKHTLDLNPVVPGSSYLLFGFDMELDPGFLGDGNVPSPSDLTGEVRRVTTVAALASNMPYPADGQNFVILRGDNLTLSERSGTPEPATWGILIIGFAMSGAALRRRRIVTFPAR